MELADTKLKDPDNFKIFSGSSNPELAEKIASILGVPSGKSNVAAFKDGEISSQICETVRGKNVYIVQSTCPSWQAKRSVNDNLMELLVVADAMRRASAATINAVIPYFGYARQDRKSRAREPITAKLVANIIATSGVDRVVTMDLHCAQIQGFFDIPVDHLVGMPRLGEFFKDKFQGKTDDLVLVSPDLGSVARVRKFATILDAPIAIIDKRRPKANEVEVVNIVGDVAGKNVILVDDMIDTAGTLCSAAKTLKEKGAEHIYACGTHAVFSGPAIGRIQESCIEELVVLDTIPLPDEMKIDKIKVLSIADVFAESLARINNDDSVSAMFED